MNAHVHFGFNGSDVLRKEIRSRNFSLCFDEVLGMYTVNVGAIENAISQLTMMGENVKEFESFVTDLLLVQLSEIQRVSKIPRLNRNPEKLGELDMSTRRYLWPHIYT